MNNNGISKTSEMKDILCKVANELCVSCDVCIADSYAAVFGLPPSCNTGVIYSKGVSE